MRSDPIFAIAPITELIFASSLFESVRYNGRYLEKFHLESKENKHKIRVPYKLVTWIPHTDFKKIVYLLHLFNQNMLTFSEQYAPNN